MHLQMSDELTEQIVRERDAYRKNLIALVVERANIRGDLSDIITIVTQLRATGTDNRELDKIEKIALRWVRYEHQVFPELEYPPTLLGLDRSPSLVQRT